MRLTFLTRRQRLTRLLPRIVAHVAVLGLFALMGAMIGGAL